MDDLRENQTNLKNLLKQIEAKINQLETKLDDMTNCSNEYNITIQQVDIHHPLLKELSFSLDSLDVKELSGALNIGNNFGSKVGQKEEKKKQPMPKAKEQPSQQSKQKKKAKTKKSEEPSIAVKIGDKNVSFSIDESANKSGGEK